MNILEYINLKPEHNYLYVLLQFSVVYVMYSLVVVTFRKYTKYVAYKHITKERVIESVPEVRPQKVAKKEKEKEKEKPVEQKGKRKNSENEKQAPVQQSHQVSYKELLKQEKHQKILQNKEKVKYTGKITHPLYLSSVKGFADCITDFSYNNRYLIACSFDNSIKLFEMEQFFKNPEQPKYLFHNLTDMHATAICISKKLDVAYFSANNQLFDLEFNVKAEDKQYFKVIPKTKNCHKSEITALHVDENDKVLVSTSSDTHIKVWNIKGELLKEINTSYGEHYGSCFMKGLLVVSSWSVDTSIYELKFNKQSFRTLEKEEVLRGEKSSVIDASLNEHGTLATICNKTQARVYKINTERKIREDARQLFKVEKANVSAAAVNENILVVAADSNVYIYNKQFEQIDEIDNAANGASIRRVRIHELHSAVKNKYFYVCFVWGQDEERVNIYDVTKYHE